MSLTEKLTDYVGACFCGLWIETCEPDEALIEIGRMCSQQNWRLAVWDIMTGVTVGDASPGSESIAIGDPLSALGKVFGNTMTSTLWRAVESCEDAVFGLVSQHPNRAIEEDQLRYFVRSRAFRRPFPSVAAIQVFRALQSFCFGNRGPIGSAEVVFTDVAGIQQVFFVEVFFNTHEALTLGVYRKVHPVLVANSGSTSRKNFR